MFMLQKTNRFCHGCRILVISKIKLGKHGSHDRFAISMKSSLTNDLSTRTVITSTLLFIADNHFYFASYSLLYHVYFYLSTLFGNQLFKHHELRGMGFPY